MAIPSTGSPLNGKTQEIKVGTYSLNCTGDVPLAPAQTAPSTEVQKFQGGDYMAVEVDGTYQPTTVTCEYNSDAWAAIDGWRSAGTAQNCSLGSFTGQAIPSVSEAPTITANGLRIPQMTVTLTWISVTGGTGTGE